MNYNLRKYRKSKFKITFTMSLDVNRLRSGVRFVSYGRPINCGALSLISNRRMTSGTVVERPVPSISFASTVSVISGDFSRSSIPEEPTVIRPETGSSTNALA